MIAVAPPSNSVGARRQKPQPTERILLLMESLQRGNNGQQKKQIPYTEIKPSNNAVLDSDGTTAGEPIQVGNSARSAASGRSTKAQKPRLGRAHLSNDGLCLIDSAEGEEEVVVEQEKEQEKDSHGSDHDVRGGSSQDKVSTMRYDAGPPHGVGDYSGQTQGGVPHGQGEMVWHSGKRYRGEWKEGKRHGEGWQRWTDGRTFDGEWQDGKPHGKGYWNSPRGEAYDGYLVEGKKSGEGTFTYPDGKTYTGSWYNGLRNGEGRRCYPDGSTYTGSWVNDKRHGMGTYTWRDGRVWAGQWNNGNPVKGGDHERNNSYGSALPRDFDVPRARGNRSRSSNSGSSGSSSSPERHRRGGSNRIITTTGTSNSWNGDEETGHLQPQQQPGGHGRAGNLRKTAEGYPPTPPEPRNKHVAAAIKEMRELREITAAAIVRASTVDRVIEPKILLGEGAGGGNGDGEDDGVERQGTASTLAGTVSEWGASPDAPTSETAPRQQLKPPQQVAASKRRAGSTTALPPGEDPPPPPQQQQQQPQQPLSSRARALSRFLSSVGRRKSNVSNQTNTSSEELQSREDGSEAHLQEHRRRSTGGSVTGDLSQLKTAPTMSAKSPARDGGEHLSAREKSRAMRREAGRGPEDDHGVGGSPFRADKTSAGMDGIPRYVKTRRAELSKSRQDLVEQAMQRVPGGSSPSRSTRSSLSTYSMRSGRREQHENKAEEERKRVRSVSNDPNGVSGGGSSSRSDAAPRPPRPPAVPGGVSPTHSSRSAHSSRSHRSTYSIRSTNGRSGRREQQDNKGEEERKRVKSTRNGTDGLGRGGGRGRSDAAPPSAASPLLLKSPMSRGRRGGSSFGKTKRVAKAGLNEQNLGAREPTLNRRVTPARDGVGRDGSGRRSGDKYRRSKSLPRGRRSTEGDRDGDGESGRSRSPSHEFASSQLYEGGGDGGGSGEEEEDDTEEIALSSDFSYDGEGKDDKGRRRRQARNASSAAPKDNGRSKDASSSSLRLRHHRYKSEGAVASRDVRRGAEESEEGSDGFAHRNSAGAAVSLSGTDRNRKDVQSASAEVPAVPKASAVVFKSVGHFRNEGSEFAVEEAKRHRRRSSRDSSGSRRESSRERPRGSSRGRIHHEISRRGSAHVLGRGRSGSRSRSRDGSFLGGSDRSATAGGGVESNDSKRESVEMQFDAGIPLGRGKYVGHVKEGLPDGKGTIEWPKGKRYTGSWKNGKRHGYGTFNWEGGQIHQGEWVNNKAHGKGTLLHGDGTTYTGEWVEGLKHGQGTHTYPGGMTYEGGWASGMRQGKGVWCGPDGMYEGDYVSDKKEGFGTYTWGDGRKYVGAWHDGKQHGKGILYSKDGKITLQGRWKKGEKTFFF